MVAAGKVHYLKEKDLSGHFEAEKTRSGKKTGKIRIVEEKLKVPKGEDIQLERAMDYLKSWFIFESLRKGGVRTRFAG